MSTFAEPVATQNAPAERRFYPRIAPSALINMALGQNNEGMILNVSENGLLVSSPEELHCNFVSRVWIPLNGLRKAIQVHVRVIWTNELQKRAGLQLLDLSEYDREQIRKWQALETLAKTKREQPEEQSAPAAVDPFSSYGATVPAMDIPEISQTSIRSRTRARGSALAVSLWVAVPVVATLGIILLLRMGLLHNPLLHSAPSTEDTSLNTQLPTHPPQPNAPNLLSRNRGATKSPTSRKLNSDDEDALAETNPIALPNTAPTTLTQPSPRPEEKEPRKDQPSANNAGSEQNATSDLTQYRPPSQSEAHDSSANQGPGQQTPGSSAGNDNSAPAYLPTLNQSDRAQNSIVASTVAPKPAARGGSFLAKKSEPAPASSNEVIDVRPESHHTSFLALPGERILDSPAVSMRIQRSVLVPGDHKLWPFHHSKKVALGQLVSHIDPQVSQLPSDGSSVVTVRASVDQDGHVKSVQPLTGSAALVPSVVTAVHDWRYQPTLVDGKPVETQADIQVEFHKQAAVAKP